MSYASNRRAFFALSDNLKGAMTIMVAALGFTLMITLIKLAGERLHITQILFLRQFMVTLIVLPSIVSHFPGCLRTARLDLQLLRVAAALVAMLCGFTAVIHLPLAEATALGFAKAFFVTIFAILILRERVGAAALGGARGRFSGRGGDGATGLGSVQIPLPSTPSREQRVQGSSWSSSGSSRVRTNRSPSSPIKRSWSGLP